MEEPSFDPENAAILHHSIFFSGIYDRLTSENNAIEEYENLCNALRVIGARKSEKVIETLLTIFRPITSEGFDRIEQEIKTREGELEELYNQYLASNEDIPQLILDYYESFSN